MTFGLDFDNTFSADPELWAAFILAAVKRGHDVICVTKREPSLPTGLEALNVRTIYTSRRSKLAVTREQGVHIDVWIDDTVTGIIADDGQRITVG